MRSLRRRHMLNEGFFTVVDSEDKAYWFGFLAADGYISEKGVRLDLQARDRAHLEKFRASLASTHAIFDRTDTVRLPSGRTGTYPHSYVYIPSVILATRLAELGLTPKKSHRVQPCTEIRDDVAHHYWRGVFDGDGHISRNGNSWTVGLCGNSFMVQGFAAFIRQFCRTTVRPILSGAVWRVAYSGTLLPQTIVRLLYHNATIWLDRKKKLADQLLAAPVRRHDLTYLDLQELGELHAQEGSWKRVADVLGIRYDTLAHRRCRLHKLAS